ncbi:MAG: hypothetical protein KGN02_01295 [bacterium]|nr:hypothetical protein [bacterium]
MNIMALTDCKGFGHRLTITASPLLERETLTIFANDLQMRIPLTLALLSSADIAIDYTPLTESELDDAALYATRVDDALAQAISIAQHRGLVMLTDDNAGIDLALTLGLPIRTTLDLAQSWCASHEPEFARSACLRLKLRSRFLVPHRPAAPAEWYRSHA